MYFMSVDLNSLCIKILGVPYSLYQLHVFDVCVCACVYSNKIMIILAHRYNHERTLELLAESKASVDATALQV